MRDLPGATRAVRAQRQREVLSWLPDGFTTPERRQAWALLSELYLDTELGARDFERLARALAGTGFSVAELGQIYRREVAPACVQNFYSVAGEWVSFDAEWLEGRILAWTRLAHVLRRVPFAVPLRCWSASWSTRHDWQKIAESLMRSTSPPL